MGAATTLSKLSGTMWKWLRSFGCLIWLIFLNFLITIRICLLYVKKQRRFVSDFSGGGFFGGGSKKSNGSGRSAGGGGGTSASPPPDLLASIRVSCGYDPDFSKPTPKLETQSLGP